MAYDFNSLTKQADEASNRDKFYTDFEDVDPNVLHQISELTDWMRTKAKGSDVREVIAQLFERTWLEESKKGNANLEVSKARGRFPVLNERLNNADRERAENTRKLAQKANKDEVTNVMTPKGTLAYASLPTSGNQVGWYYYCPDGDGTHGAGNYVWNGTSWYFGGTGDAGYNLLKEDNVELKNSLNDMFVANNIFDVDYVESGYYTNTNNIVPDFFHFKFKALRGDIISFTRYKLFEGQWGIVLNSDKLYGSIASLSPDTSNDEYVSFVMPINGEVIVNMRSYIATMISVNADYPNEYTPCKIQANKNIKYTYDNAEYISKYNLFDSSKLQDGFVLANGDIDTAYNDNFKHINIAVKTGDVVRFTKQEVFSTQAGGIYNKDGFMSNLSTYMKDKISHYEYECTDTVCMLKINVRIDQPAIAKVITKNNDFTELFGKSYVSNIAPDSESINVLKNIFMTTFDYSALFSNGVSIGDSLTAGDYGNGEGVHAYNYPKAFSKITGIAMTNKGRSGSNAKSWWIEENPTVEQYIDYDLAFILFGQNGGLSGNINSGDDSNAGYYCKIIELLKTANPNMAIFLLTIPVNGAYRVNEPTNEIIKAIGKKYDIPVLDIYNDSKILNHANMPIYQPYDGVLHYGKVGALALATEVKRLMNDSISRDLSRYNVIDS